MSRKALSFLFLALAYFSNAQEAVSEPQMANTFRSEGKIYVVITVIAMIFVALTVFLILLERKIKKIEKQLNKE